SSTRGLFLSPLSDLPKARCVSHDFLYFLISCLNAGVAGRRSYRSPVYGLPDAVVSFFFFMMLQVDFHKCDQ
ncbi:MAG TPA: hypothetical protein VLB84_08435, partial [Bacteroidia bacterium]|nr:hypothetical protein [Bacteroidia bacterium]